MDGCKNKSILSITPEVGQYLNSQTGIIALKINIVLFYFVQRLSVDAWQTILLPVNSAFVIESRGVRL